LGKDYMDWKTIRTQWLTMNLLPINLTIKILSSIVAI